MANVVYDNFWLSNEIEDQFNSHLNLQQFCTIDDSLVGEPGMKRQINVYKASDGTEKLSIGEGNTKSIEVSYSDVEYEILLAQNRFDYYDEQAMKDPMLVPVGTKHMGTDMFNTVNADVFAEFNKAILSVSAIALDFDAFADAVALLNIENTDNDPKDVAPKAFAFVCAKDMATIRKNTKDTLQYIEAFARGGYVGTLAGVNLYTKKDAVEGTVIVATKEAVTIFNKKGTEVEQERDGNTRKNSIFSRKYYIAALTDQTKAVKIVVGSTSKQSTTSTKAAAN